MMMSSEMLWQRLETNAALESAMRDASAILDSGSNLEDKQMQIQTLVATLSLQREMFVALHEELESDMEEDEKDTLLDVWRLEVTVAQDNGAQTMKDAAKTLSLRDADMEVVQALVKAQAVEASLAHALKQVKEDNEEEKDRLTKELKVAEQTSTDCTKAYKKLRRSNFMQARKEVLLSPKRAAPPSPHKSEEEGIGAKRQCLSPLAGPSGQDPSWDIMTETWDKEVDSYPQVGAGSLVSVEALLEGMLEEKDVIVKLLHVPFEVSTPPVRSKPGSTFDLFEAIVAANGKEYRLIAKGDMVASKALEQTCGSVGEVLKLTRTKFAQFQGDSQIELMEGFGAYVHDTQDQTLKQQSLKRIALSRLPSQTDRAKVSLQPCMVSVASEVRLDKKGKPYRSTRLVDASGNVCNVMIWGALAAQDQVWANGASVDIGVASINCADERIDLRSFSNAKVIAQGTEFQRPRRLQYLKWSSSGSSNQHSSTS